LTIFGVVLLGTGVVLVWRDRRKNGPIEGRYFVGMLVESVIYAVLFGVVTSLLTTLVLQGPNILALGPIEGQGLPTQVMVSLGAGIYEELLFRVLIVGALSRFAIGAFQMKPFPAGVFATLLGAVIFAAFHYIGPLGDSFELTSFTFRTIAGVLLSALYLVRGFGVTAWTHALYDVLLTIAR
jgi:membrane protease YdiL (CAAX protease family)